MTINKMKPIWAIQGGIINDSDAKGMLLALDNLNIPFEILKIAPFDYENIPDINYSGPIIPYGGTRFIDKIRTTKKWTCWFNENFSYKIYLSKFDKHMFNSDAEVMMMKDFCPSNYNKHEHIFIRPDKDLKEFAGNNIKPKEFMSWYRRIEKQGMEVGENTEIVVAKSSRIDVEWRIFVCNGIPISGSQYRKNHYLSVVDNVPERVYTFVKDMIKIWTPAPVFVMDICELSGELYILELGDFHSSGWYYSDKLKIIDSISKYSEKVLDF